MTEEDKQNIKEEINDLQNKIDNLVNRLEAESEDPTPETEVQYNEDVVKDEDIPVVNINASKKRKEQ